MLYNFLYRSCTLHFVVLTYIHKLLQEFRSVSPKLKFSLELEAEKQVNSAIIALRKSQNSIQVTIYDWLHYIQWILLTYQHKLPGIKYLNRMNGYPIKKEEKQKYLASFESVVRNNQFYSSYINRMHNKIGKIQQEDTRK